MPKICPHCGRRLSAAGTEGARPAPKARFSRLSLRQSQIVQLVRQAKANKEIAVELGLNEGTVRQYLGHIFRKLGVKNRTELAVQASELSTKSAQPNLKSRAS